MNGKLLSRWAPVALWLCCAHHSESVASRWELGILRFETIMALQFVPFIRWTCLALNVNVLSSELLFLWFQTWWYPKPCQKLSGWLEKDPFLGTTGFGDCIIESMGLPLDQRFLGSAGHNCKGLPAGVVVGDFSRAAPPYSLAEVIVNAANIQSIYPARGSTEGVPDPRWRVNQRKQSAIFSALLLDIHFLVDGFDSQTLKGAKSKHQLAANTSGLRCLNSFLVRPCAGGTFVVIEGSGFFQPVEAAGGQCLNGRMKSVWKGTGTVFLSISPKDSQDHNANFLNAYS